MDIKAKIDGIVERCEDNPKFKEDFFQNPATTIRNTLGVEISDEQLETIVEGVKAKLELTGIGGGVGDFFRTGLN